jgi:hypothetical protein
MSYTTLYSVYKTKVKVIEEYRNSHGSAPPVWEYVTQKYCGKPPDAYIFFAPWMEKVYRPETLSKLPEHWRRVLLFLADGALIKDANLQQFSANCKSVFDELQAWPEWGGRIFVNHWAAIGIDFAKLRPNKRRIGVGIGCTSVSDPWEEYSSAHGELWKAKLFDVFAD